MSIPLTYVPLSLNLDNTFDTYGLDFKYVASHLSNGNTSVGKDDEADQYTNIDSFNLSSTGKDITNNNDEMANSGQLIYLSGYPSSERMKQLTQVYGINPEFWRRHFAQIPKPSTTIFEDTKVPSSTCDIFQLRVWTIGSRGGSVPSNWIGAPLLRKNAAVLMDKYKDGLSSGVGSTGPWKTGDSMVRRYEVHDQQYFSIEQLLSIYVSTIPDSGQTGKKWFVLVYSDCGKDLWQSPQGPWLGIGLPRQAEYYTRFLPVPEHQLWTRSLGLPTTPFSQRRDHPKSTLRELPQSLRKLPSTYKSFQDDVVSSQDPLYALSGIFGFFISSEAQVLSFLATHIEVNSSQGQQSSEVADTDSVSNLLHCQQLLEGHIEELQYVLNIFQSHGLSSWPKADDGLAASTAASLQLDLDYLLKRAYYLKSRCETYLSLAMNVASIGEARRGIKHNKALFRFTVLASVYVPLSFTASLFGMNFKQFGQGELSVWLYIAVSVPIFTLSAFFLFFKPEAVSNAWRKMRKSR